MLKRLNYEDKMKMQFFRQEREKKYKSEELLLYIKLFLDF